MTDHLTSDVTYAFEFIHEDADGTGITIDTYELNTPLPAFTDGQTVGLWNDKPAVSYWTVTGAPDIELSHRIDGGAVHVTKVYVKPEGKL